MTLPLGFELISLENKLTSRREPLSFSLPENYEEKLKTQSNFVLQSLAYSELGGSDGKSALIASYSKETPFPSEIFLITNKDDTDFQRKLGVIVHLFGRELNDELFYIISQNIVKSFRVKGTMVKGMDSEIWIRIAKEASLNGIDLKFLANVLSDRLLKQFPEIESCRIILIDNSEEEFAQLKSFSEKWDSYQQQLKASVWASRGYNFKDCHVLGHCGQCADKKLCANVRKMDRIAVKKRVN